MTLLPRLTLYNHPHPLAVIWNCDARRRHAHSSGVRVVSGAATPVRSAVFTHTPEEVNERERTDPASARPFTGSQF